MEQFYKFNELTNYPTGDYSTIKCIIDGHCNVLSYRRFLQATLQPQLVIYSTLYAAAAWTIAISDNEQSVISCPTALC